MTKINRNQLEDTYFNFTEGKSALQAGKIEKSLDIIVRYDMGDTEQTGSKKVMVFDKLSAGFLPEIEENYSYYSVRKEDYTKPKTLYKLENNEGTWIEINKTLHEYALHLIKNDFLNGETATAFIAFEQLTIEKERQEQERIEAENRKQAEKKRIQEEKERKEQLKKKQITWLEKGNTYINSLNKNPITELLENHWEEVSAIYKGQSKTDYMDYFIKEFTMMLGNESSCSYWMLFFIEQDNCPDDNFPREFSLTKNPRQFLQRELLYKVFNDVCKSDSSRTITAKIKAKLNNRQYKGATPAKQYDFYYFNGKEKEFVKASGTRHVINGIILYMYSFNGKEYSLIEESSGMPMGRPGTNKAKTLEDAKEIIDNRKDQLLKAIKNAINKYGGSPLINTVSV